MPSCNKVAKANLKLQRLCSKEMRIHGQYQLPHIEQGRDQRLLTSLINRTQEDNIKHHLFMCNVFKSRGS